MEKWGGVIIGQPL
ncbi:truncated MGF_110-13L [African swine fever virus]|nr:truncated MGF_110-13L [African swine fever virus]WFS78466.1 truncated MGF_110-13L [African swine fever virus]